MPEHTNQTEQAARSYKAFISYRHKPLDKEAAAMIQKSIEHYTIPPEMRNENGDKKFGPVFRDEDELPISSNLSDSITYALDHSEYLIVICTPDLPKSRWCEQEIRHFIATHDREHVIAVLADGTPETSFSPYLLHRYDAAGNITADIEPLAANIGGANHTIDRKAYRKEIIRIFAALLGCPFDALYQRERRARTSRLLAGAGVVLAAMTVFLGVTLKQNKTINEQNRDLETRMSSMKVDAGYEALNAFDRKLALTNAVEALASGDPSIYDHRAENLLIRTLGAYEYGEYSSELLYRQATAIADLQVSSDGKYAYLCDTAGMVSMLDAEKGKLLWQAPSWQSGQESGSALSRLYPAEAAGTIICKNPGNTIGLSAADGTIRWNYKYEEENGFIAVSPDGKTAAVLDRTYYIPDTYDVNPVTDLKFLDTQTGEEKGLIQLSQDDRIISLSDETPYSYGAAFSASGRYFGCALYQRGIEDYSDGSYKFVLADTEENKTLMDGQISYVATPSNLFLGIDINEETRDMFTVQYHPRYGSVLITILHPDNMTYDTDSITHTLQMAPGGDLFRLDYNDIRFCPLIAAGNKAAFSLEDTLYLLNRTTGTLLKSYTLAGDILQLAWLDEEDQLLTVTSGGGFTAVFDLTDEEGETFEAMIGSTFDQTDMALAGMIRGGLITDDNDGALLSVPGGQKTDIVRTGVITDPHRKDITLKEDLSSYRTAVIPSTVPERYFVLTYPNDGLVVSMRDTATDEVLATAEFGADSGIRMYDCRSDSLTALDEEHVAAGKWILGMDGKITYPEGIDEESFRNVNGSDFYTRKLYNGQVLSVYDASGAYPAGPLRLWLDQAALIEESGRIVKPEGDLFTVGNNGFVIIYGLSEEKEELQFFLYDALEGTWYELDNRQADAEISLLEPGTEKDVFACGDSSGGLYLYHIKDNQTEALSDAYSIGELKSLAFIPGDRYLAVLTNTGRLDILDTETHEQVFSQMIDDSLTDRYFLDLDCISDTDHHRVILKIRSSDYNMYGYMAIVDTDSWTLSWYGKKSVLTWLPAANRIYAAEENGIGSYPAYTLDELKTWAEETLTEE